MRGPREASTFSPRLRLAAFGLLAALVAAVLASSGSAAPGSGLQRAILVQEQRSAGLLSRGAIVGTGVGRSDSGEAEIVVLAKRTVRVADTLDGVPVELNVTGPISARPAKPAKRPDGPGKGNGGGGGGGGGEESQPSPTGRFTRPVPIGVSTGNAEECSAGTIGARVSDAENVYAISNNHVYARANEGKIGEVVLQPGRYDTGCVDSGGNDLGTLDDYEPIDFSTGARNVMDAAIALIPAEGLGTSTPFDGYGEPSSETQAAFAGLAVQKYGRTTGLTSGGVVAVNGIVNVSYSAGTARFEDQVFVEGRKPFLKSGDSGSLLVTKSLDAKPVGLLFAGGSSGKFAVANPIDPVLERFGVEIDGK